MVFRNSDKKNGTYQNNESILHKNWEMESVQPVQPGFKVDIKSRGRFNEFKKVIWEIDLQHGFLMRRCEPPIKSRTEVLRGF